MVTRVLDPRARYSINHGIQDIDMIYRSLLEQVSKLDTKSANELVLVKAVQALLQRAIAEEEAKAAQPRRGRDAMEDRD